MYSVRSSRIQVGNQHAVYGRSIKPMTSSTVLYNEALRSPVKAKQLRDRMDKDGFLLVANILPVEEVQAARNVMIDLLHANGELHVDANTTADDAVMFKGRKLPGHHIHQNTGG